MMADEEVNPDIQKVERKIEDLERKIDHAQREIEDAQREIEAVEKQLQTAPSSDIASYLRDKESKLRDEESKLRDRESKLREEKSKLLDEKSELRKDKKPEQLMSETIMKQFTDIMKHGSFDIAVKNLSMSTISTKVADKVLKMAGFMISDGSALEPPEEVSVSSEWKFDMGQYASEGDCYEPFFDHMVKYLNRVHNVEIRKDPPYPRGVGCCRLLDVHKLGNVLELEAELDDRTLKITGNLDAVFVPPRCGPLQYKEFLLGGVKVQHSAAHKELFKHGAPADDIANSGRSAVPLMEALAVYAHSEFPKGIFLFTSYDENVVMVLEDREILCWTELNFAQAMDKIAAFLKDELVRGILDNHEKPVRSREEPHISESKRSVRKKLKIEGLGNEEFLEQVDAVRSVAGSKLEMVSDLFQLMECWRYRTTEACGSAGPFRFFS